MAIPRNLLWQYQGFLLDRIHREVHTLSVDLAKIAMAARPKLLVTYHRIYHLDVFSDQMDVDAEIQRRSEAILKEIREAGYEGAVVNGQDLDIF